MKRNADYELPRTLALRLARLHLVDMVKGQTNTFSSEEVKDLDIKISVANLSDAQVEIEITGRSRAASEGAARRTSPHGVKTQLLGSATFDREQERFTKFELLAIGSRWGYTRFNGRRRQEEESRVGFVFRLADSNTPRIAPAFVHRYDASWIAEPKR